MTLWSSHQGNKDRTMVNGALSIQSKGEWKMSVVSTATTEEHARNQTSYCYMSYKDSIILFC